MIIYSRSFIELFSAIFVSDRTKIVLLIENFKTKKNVCVLLNKIIIANELLLMEY